MRIAQNWAGGAWPQRGQLYKGARYLLRERKEERKLAYISRRLCQSIDASTLHAKPKLRNEGGGY